MVNYLDDFKYAVDDYTVGGGPVSYVAGRVATGLLFDSIRDGSSAIAAGDYTGVALSAAELASKPLNAGLEIYGAFRKAGKVSDKVEDVTNGRDDLVDLYKAVGPKELADIKATDQFRSISGLEGKYFTTSGEAASD